MAYLWARNTLGSLAAEVPIQAQTEFNVRKENRTNEWLFVLYFVNVSKKSDNNEKW